MEDKDMRHEVVEIKVDGQEEAAYLYTYFLDNSPEMGSGKKRPVIVICPGGGYMGTSDREAEVIAIQFLAAGLHAVVLRYSVFPSRYPTALLQLAQTVRFLREHAEAYFIDPDHIIVQGFSAGGHLAASLGVFWDKPFVADALHTDACLCRPDALLLCYPVITSGEKAHIGSFECLLGEELETRREELSVEKYVSPQTPPVFLWHTATDDCVPVENSLLFFQAAHAAGVRAELHIYPVGGHGLALANAETANPDGYGVQAECQSWLELAKKWIAAL